MRTARPPKSPEIYFPREIHYRQVPNVDLTRFPISMVLESRLTLNSNVYASLEVRLSMHVFNRDAPRNSVTVYFQRNVHPLELENMETEDWVYRFVQEAVIHELQECWIVDGVRLRDPHANKKVEVPEAIGTYIPLRFT